MNGTVEGEGVTQQKIPKTIEAATQELNGLGALLTAKNWARAAIVYAFTEPTRQGQRNDLTSRNSGKFSPGEFAALKIVGLTNAEDVGYYRAAWQTAIEDGQAEVVAPGQTATLPERAWPPSPRTRDVKDVIRSTVRNHPEKIVAVLAESEMAGPVAELLAEDPGFQFGALLNEKKRIRSETVRDAVPMPTREIDHSAELRASVNRIMPVLHAMRDGTWTPDAMEFTLLSFLAQAFAELAGGQSPAVSVFDEIEAYLGAARA